MADLEDVRIRATADVRWPDGHPRANENPPELEIEDEDDSSPEEEDQ